MSKFIRMIDNVFKLESVIAKNKSNTHEQKGKNTLIMFNALVYVLVLLCVFLYLVLYLVLYFMYSLYCAV